MTIARALLWVSAVMFAGFGAAFAIDPAGMAGLVSIELPTATARAEIAAMYGGLEIGIAAFLAWCAIDASRVRLGLVAAGLMLAGLGLGRIWGAAAEAQPVEAVMYWFAAIEIAAAGASLGVAARLAGRRA